MPQKILLTKTAEKDLEKLDPVVKKRIRGSILKYAQEPLVHVRKLTSPRIGTYRWRIGRYRIIFDLKKDKIVILRIGHRREIYR